MSELRDHMAAYTGPEESALVFTGSLGGVLRRGNFRRDSGWSAAVSKLGIPGLHFHDLRHTGNTLAAPGASLGDPQGADGP
jgi:integrase